MRYAQVRDGVVVNIVRVDTPELASRLQLREIPDGVGIGWHETDGTWSAPPPAAVRSPHPNEEVPAHKFLMALDAYELTPTVEAWLNSKPSQFRRAWERTPTFSRSSVMIALAATDIGVSSETLDNLFAYAMSIQT